MTTHPVLLDLAAACRAAVDEGYLAGCPEGPQQPSAESYSCCAAQAAAGVLFSWDRAEVAFDAVSTLLFRMGVGSFGAFSDIPRFEGRQSARALWLTMLAVAIEAGDMDPEDFGL